MGYYHPYPTPHPYATPPRRTEHPIAPALPCFFLTVLFRVSPIPTRPPHDPPKRFLLPSSRLIFPTLLHRPARDLSALPPGDDPGTGTAGESLRTPAVKAMPSRSRRCSLLPSPVFPTPLRRPAHGTSAVPPIADPGTGAAGQLLHVPAAKAMPSLSDTAHSSRCCSVRPLNSLHRRRRQQKRWTDSRDPIFSATA